jgi:hypothetical protein
MSDKKVRTRLTERDEAVIRNARFFEPYKKELEGLFMAIGKQDEWSDDPRQMLDYLRSRWIGREHGNDLAKDQFSEEQVAAAMPYFDMLGLTVEDTPEITDYHFDQMIILGGFAATNRRRLAFGLELLKNNNATVDTIIFFLGERPRSVRDGTNEQILGINEAKSAGDVRENPWVKQLTMQGAFTSPPLHDLNETDVGRIAMLQLMGNSLMPYRVEVDESDAAGRIKDYYFRTDTGQEILLINAAAVDRGIDRPRRHTSKSCAVEWLERHAPKRHAKVLYITDNPSTLRTALDTYAVLKKYGRDDIHLIPAGPAPYKTQAIQTYLGEIARLIDNDVRRNH